MNDDTDGRLNFNSAFSQNQNYQFNNSKQSMRFQESPKRKPIFGYRSMIPTNRISQSDLPKDIDQLRNDQQYKGRNKQIAEGLQRMIDILQIKFKEMEKLKEENWVLRRENNELREREYEWRREEEEKRMLEEMNVQYKRKIFQAKKQLQEVEKKSSIEGLKPILSILHF